ncbi:MAG: ECF transporter S component [Clostridia bacterium]|nr:ECF transporter S component [Clostridia bacterium]
MNAKIKKTVMASLLAALCCIATMIIKVPSPLNGYLNLGDSVVLLCGWMLSPLYGFLAAGLGSALADLFSGYVAYAPATFVIKGLMAVTAYLVLRFMKNRMGSVPSRVIGGIAVEVLMVAGYFVFEGFMYGFGASAVNIPANGVQGVAGLVLGVILAGITEKSRIK